MMDKPPTTRSPKEASVFKHQHLTASGRLETRNSKTTQYSHVVIGTAREDMTFTYSGNRKVDPLKKGEQLVLRWCKNEKNAAAAVRSAPAELAPRSYELSYEAVNGGVRDGVDAPALRGAGKAVKQATKPAAAKPAGGKKVPLTNSRRRALLRLSAGPQKASVLNELSRKPFDFFVGMGLAERTGGQNDRYKITKAGRERAADVSSDKYATA